MFDRIQKQAESAIRELLEVSKLRPGDLLVIGCSSSEIMGERIGKGSSMEAAQAVYDGIAPVLEQQGGSPRCWNSRGSCWRCSAAST